MAVCSLHPAEWDQGKNWKVKELMSWEKENLVRHEKTYKGEGRRKEKATRRINRVHSVILTAIWPMASVWAEAAILATLSSSFTTERDAV